MPVKSNIVLLTTGSRESTDKARSWGQAARSLGLSVKFSPDRHTVSVIHCSDFKIIEAAWLCRAHNIPGPDPVAATIVASKALSYEFLRALGFNVLFSYVPMEAADLRIRFNKPIIVKPEYGSGTSRLHPWAYGVFDGVADFRRYLEKQGLLDQFFSHQQAPFFQTGRYLVMEFIDAERLCYVETLINDRETVACDQRSLWLRKPEMTVETSLCGERFRDAKSVVAMAREFARIGLRRTLLGFQCVEKNGKLYPIDPIVRPAASFGLLAEKLNLRFFEQALAFMLGVDRKFKFAWPARYVGVRRIYAPRKQGRYVLQFDPGCIPLVSNVSYRKKAYDDMGHAWGAFGLVCKGRKEFLDRVRKAVASTRVRRVA
jgi:hypothetical protein